MKTICAAAMLSLLLLTGCTSAQDSGVHSRELFAMDTYMSLKAYGAHAEEALGEAAAKINDLEGQLSVTDTGSEIYAANHAGGSAVPISAETAAILQEARRTAAESGNALQISVYPLVRTWGFTTGEYRVPADSELAALCTHVGDARISFDSSTLTVPADMEIDLGALAKGFAGDAAAEIMRRHGVTSAIINLGGNVQAVGTKPDGSKWTVGVRDPFNENQLCGTVHVADKAVVTSGNYERCFTAEDGTKYWHIIDPASGRPADSGLCSVTVIGGSGLRCDALSTALFVEGTERAAAHWRACSDFEMVLVTAEMIYVTEGIAGDFSVGSTLPFEVLRR